MFFDGVNEKYPGWSTVAFQLWMRILWSILTLLLLKLGITR